MSTSFREKPGQDKKIEYDPWNKSGFVFGKTSRDDFFMDKRENVGVKQLSFLAVNSASRIDWIKADGVLGLGPMPRYIPREWDDRYSFVNQLK
jgi:hypothetical protein